MTIPESTSRTAQVPAYDAPPLSAALTGMTILRVGVGGIFIAHGVQKLFMMGVPAITGGFTQWHIPLPGISAPFVTGLEFAGGILLVLGVIPRVLAALFTIEMLCAVALVHFRNGFFLPTGYEFALLLAVLSLAIAVGGPGRWPLWPESRMRNRTLMRP